MNKIFNCCLDSDFDLSKLESLKHKDIKQWICVKHTYPGLKTSHYHIVVEVIDKNVVFVANLLDIKVWQLQEYKMKIQNIMFYLLSDNNFSSLISSKLDF